MVVTGIKGCAVYLDDVIIYSETWREHVDRIGALFERFTWANHTVNLAKCEFTQGTVTYFGKVVSHGQVRLVRAKVLAIDQFPPPTTKKELVHFLGVVRYYRGFLQKLLQSSCPSYQLVEFNGLVWLSPSVSVCF